MPKPMKTLRLHYLMIQFLILTNYLLAVKAIIPFRLSRRSIISMSDRKRRPRPPKVPDLPALLLSIVINPLIGRLDTKTLKGALFAK